MSLTLNQGKKFLKQIVGGNGAFASNFQVRYLGLSSTPPSNTPDASGKYNITEPTPESYDRVPLEISGQELYFKDSDISGAEDPVTHEYVITIKNSSEIHFNECVGEAWGWVKYFVIFETANSQEPLYFGTLITEDERGVEITLNTVPLVRKEQLIVSVK